MTFRMILFWLHLAAGVVVAFVVLNMSVTGMIMAFEPQIEAFADRDVRRVAAPSPPTPRLGLDALLAGLSETFPKARVAAVTVSSDPEASVAVNLGREAGTVYVNPYSGAVLGKGSKVHDFMHAVEGWHRRLSTGETAGGGEAGAAAESRPLGRSITGVSAIAFFFMVLSGVYLWWPASLSLRHLRPVTLFQGGLSGRARDFNWHNTIGFWSAPILLMMTLTGTVMSYRWANDLLYRLTGSEPPRVGERAREGEGMRRERPAGERRDRGERPQGDGGAARPQPSANLAAAWASAEKQVPGWVSISVRFPRRDGAPFTASILEPGQRLATARSQLTLDAATGAVVTWEPFADQNAGRKARAWVRPLHTGVAFGLIGQVFVFAAAGGATVLVWTGVALSLRRLAAWRSRRRRVVAEPIELRPSPMDAA
jgi:uncharacterized iron-regulated membrane protein